MIKKLSLIIILIISVTLLTGCGQTDTTIDIQYSSELSGENIGEGNSLAVAEFLDKTNKTGVAGAKNAVGNVTMTYRPTTSIGKSVRNTLATALEERGFKVDKIGLWDLNSENVDHLKNTFTMGGKIKTFWAENRPNVDIGSRGFGEVKLYILVVNSKTGEQVWVGQVEGGVTRSKMLGTVELEEMLNGAFSTAIDKLLSSIEFKEAVQNYEPPEEESSE